MIPVFDPAAPAASGCVATPPLVSVCMTAYNHAPYIGRAIEGVLSQRTTFAVELVLSDDCSPDGTGAICRDYAARYPDRIRLLTGDVNVGMRANYRRTIEACRGRYVAMCDGDDWWCDPLKLQRQVEALEADPACGLSYTRSERRFEATGERRRYPAGELFCDFDRLLFDNTVENCTAVARRELILRYYAEVRPEEHPEWLTDDWPMWLWFACRSRIRFIDRVTAVHRRMVGSVSHGDSYRGRLASRDSAMETSLWFDERFTASRNRFRILRRRHVVGLWLLSWKGAGVGEYLARWWADLRRTPRLVFCPEGAIFLVKKILFRRKKQHL